MDENALIEEFRKTVIEDLIQKGVRPPKPDSEEERELYDQWYKGKQLLQDQHE